MSNLEDQPGVTVVGGDPADGPAWELLPGRDVVLGGTRAMGTDDLRVSRVLPNRTRRMVGAWCFVDDFGRPGPEGGGANGAGMDVPPHPHTGLQTVTWLLGGQVVHHDSLGNTQPIHPGQLNLMTAGRGIAHAEVTPVDTPVALRGVQLWVALPDDARGVAPLFDHHEDLPDATETGLTVRVLIGELAGLTSPARRYSPVVGAELTLDADVESTLPLDPGFEYAVLGLDSEVAVDGVALEPGPLLYLGRGRRQLSLSAARTARLLILGGEPFTEKIVMWWNFIGRDHDEIVADREDWMAGRRFGPVSTYAGERLLAPPMPTTTLLPRGRVP